MAMENGEIFKAEELVTLCENLVIAPIVNSLVFKTKDRFGYVNGDSLVDYNNERYRLKQDEELVIAHPVHLYLAGCWSYYQKDIFGKKLVQPFKQVFRELYFPNADELKEQTQSRRYAGHQVQPKKAFKMGRGSINILPVHSSHRGRISLPFIDSDPKSAEIISKIIFLAEDGKIKDPSVLEQIIS